jgi:hypothetical protein
MLRANFHLVLELEIRCGRYKKNWAIMKVSTAYNNWPVREFQRGLCIPLTFLGAVAVGNWTTSVYSWKLVAPYAFYSPPSIISYHLSKFNLKL